MTKATQLDLAYAPHDDFDGDDFVQDRDGARLLTQFEAVQSIMGDGDWHTLGDVSQAAARLGVACPEASASAQIRNMRKARFGAAVIERRHVGNGLYQYRRVIS